MSESDKENEVDKEMKVKGFINLHLQECQNELCICKNYDDMYDIVNDKYLELIDDPHKN